LLPLVEPLVGVETEVDPGRSPAVTAVTAVLVVTAAAPQL
jgi:hypothetical protein